MWDTSGQDRFKPITANYFRGGHGFLIFFSVIDRKSFEAVKFWKELIGSHSDIAHGFILVGNKCDLENERVVSYDEGKSFADSLGIPYIETSSKYGYNIGRTLEILIFHIIPSLNSKNAQNIFNCNNN
ncbi:unnamed protein product [Blepharisma stoltei]|uniref:GTP-binding protein n=1 Tax=Blepharisma stoltei TaxID=1481888 RepID=A0AAU9IPH7_9CILI|nr:unnamed protein product [Blepharisma stoltei]